MTYVCIWLCSCYASYRHLLVIDIKLIIAFERRRLVLVLAAPVTAAEGDLFLSPQCRLLADAPACDDYIYDGAGHCIVLPEAIKASTAWCSCKM